MAWLDRPLPRAGANGVSAFPNHPPESGLAAFGPPWPYAECRVFKALIQKRTGRNPPMPAVPPPGLAASPLGQNELVAANIMHGGPVTDCRPASTWSRRPWPCRC